MPTKTACRSSLRCTGYRKIFAVVKLASRFLRGEIPPEIQRPEFSQGLIGASIMRPTAYMRACGTAQFTADIPVNDALHLAAVRSPHHHALIKGIDTQPSLEMPGVVGVMTGKDIKGTNRIKYLVADQQVLCDRKVQVLGDPVALVAAHGRREALAGAEAVQVEYEPMPSGHLVRLSPKMPHRYTRGNPIDALLRLRSKETPKRPSRTRRQW